MSDLISRKALLEEYKKLLNDYYRVPQEKIHNLIANAPSVECKTSSQQGEPVAWALFYDNGIVHHVTKYEPPTKNGSHLGYKPLYTATQHSERILQEQQNTIAELKEINLELQFQINLILNSESLEQAVRPAIKWLCENKHPHSKIIIDSSSYELVDGIAAGIIQTYIKD